MKGSRKQNRELRVLLGLVDYYLKTGKPVGSNTLKEAGFEELSSATIRNYFAHLEKENYLIQQHTSGGRIPTHSAYRFYAKEHFDFISIPREIEQTLKKLRSEETREVAGYLQKAAEEFSSQTQLAVFLSAPRFDNDYIVGVRLVPIDAQRAVCVIITDFGVIRTEILNVDAKLSAFTVKRLEAYFHWRLTGLDSPELEPEEIQLAQRIYNEIFIRYLVGYSNFIDTELYRTGFSKLLVYPDFRDTTLLSSVLALFENTHSLRLLVKECTKANQLKFWIGEDLSRYSNAPLDCAVIAHPYSINKNPAGVIGVLGPTRIPYKELFGIARGFAHSISEALTRNLFKFKIAFRQPHSETHPVLQYAGEPHKLLTDRRNQ